MKTQNNISIFERQPINNDPTKGLNERFPITWFDFLQPVEIEILDHHGIKNLAQLKCCRLANIKELNRETREKLNWARKFFDMDRCEHTTLNEKFPVTWMNLDEEQRILICNNNIINLEQLRRVDITTLKGVGEISTERLLWAREFYNMEKDKPKQYKKYRKRTSKKVAIEK